MNKINTELIKIEIGKLTPEKGDIIVLTLPDTIEPSAINRTINSLHSMAKRGIGQGCGFLILHGDAKIQVIKTPLIPPVFPDNKTA